MLAKLAETSKAGDVVSNVKNNSRNFVFQHITPPNTEKTDGSTSRMKRVTFLFVFKNIFMFQDNCIMHYLIHDFHFILGDCESCDQES